MLGGCDGRERRRGFPSRVPPAAATRARLPPHAPSRAEALDHASADAPQPRALPRLLHGLHAPGVGHQPDRRPRARPPVRDQRRAQRRGGAALARGGDDGRLGLPVPGLPPAHAREPLERRRGDHAPARALRIHGIPGRLERPRLAPGLERDPGPDRPHANDRRRDLRPDRRRLEGPRLPAQARRGRDRARLRPSDRAGPHLVPALHPAPHLGPHGDPAPLQPHPLLPGGAVLRARGCRHGSRAGALPPAPRAGSDRARGAQLRRSRAGAPRQPAPPVPEPSPSGAPAPERCEASAPRRAARSCWRPRLRERRRPSTTPGRSRTGRPTAAMPAACATRPSRRSRARTWTSSRSPGSTTAATSPTARRATRAPPSMSRRSWWATRSTTARA